MKKHSCNRVNAGLPPLDTDINGWSWFEFWPLWFFYTPVVFYWIFKGLLHRNMGLPMLANPNIHLGGMIGESKTEVLSLAGPHARQFILPFVSQQRLQSLAVDAESQQVLAKAAEAGLQFPMVVKPDLGCRGVAVRVVHSESDLLNYLQEFPLNQVYILQKLAPWKAEAGIFYVRLPGESRGEVKSITLKYIPSIVGDGNSTYSQLLRQHPRTRKLLKTYLQKNGVQAERILDEGEEIALTFSGSHCRGSIFRNGNEFICKEMSDAIDQVMQDFPEFYYGRLDVKFKDIASLQAGRDFCVIEINGASSEATHIWDSRTRLRDVFVTLFWQYRTLFEIGGRLREHGRQVPTVRELIKTWISALRSSSSYPEGE